VTGLASAASLTGFDQPVDLSTASTIVWNTVKVPGVV
jgi:hypothetical protein